MGILSMMRQRLLPNYNKIESHMWTCHDSLLFIFSTTFPFCLIFLWKWSTYQFHSLRYYDYVARYTIRNTNPFRLTFFFGCSPFFSRLLFRFVRLLFSSFLNPIFVFVSNEENPHAHPLILTDTQKPQKKNERKKGCTRFTARVTYLKYTLRDGTDPPCTRLASSTHVCNRL